MTVDELKEIAKANLMEDENLLLVAARYGDVDVVEQLAQTEAYIKDLIKTDSEPSFGPLSAACENKEHGVAIIKAIRNACSEERKIDALAYYLNYFSYGEEVTEELVEHITKCCELLLETGVNPQSYMNNSSDKLGFRLTDIMPEGKIFAPLQKLFEEYKQDGFAAVAGDMCTPLGEEGSV